MSLIAKQELSMLEIERAQLSSQMPQVEKALAAENNKRNRKAKQNLLDRLSYINRRLTELSKQLEADEEAALVAAQKAAAEKAEKAAKDAEKAEKRGGAGGGKKPAPPKGKSICCADCEQDFLFSKGEQTFYAEKGLAEPTRCRDCRQERRAARPQPLQLECCDCHVDFEFSVASQRFFEENGWEQPTRCAECRKAKKAAAPKPVLINCARCHADFSFSVGAQKHFKEQGWKDPVRCKKCREEHKSETASKASSYDKVDGKMYE